MNRMEGMGRKIYFFAKMPYTEDSTDHKGGTDCTDYKKKLVWMLES